MSSRICRILSFLATLTSLHHASLAVAEQFSSLADVVQEATRSVVGVGSAFPQRVPTGGKPARRLLGTGFVVSSGGESFIATNAHVIPGDVDTQRSESLAIFLGSGRDVSMRFANLIARDETHDLALLDYDGPPLPSLELTVESVRPGDRVVFTGFPIGAVLGLFPATHEGIVSAITPIARPADKGRNLTALQMKRLRKPYDVYQLDAIAYPGNSGSAVYRQRDGKVVGVMNSVFVKESRESILSRPSGIAYAIPVKHLQELIALAISAVEIGAEQ